MTDRRCYVTELERKVSRQKRRIKELEKQNAGWQEVVDRQEALLQLRQNLINDREGQIAKLQKALDLAASNEQVRMKQLAERELVIIQKAERIKELQEANSKLILDQEYNEKLLAQHEEAAGDRPTSLERDIQRALNYWGADADLGTADFILAHFLNRQLLSLKAMKRAEREHGIPPIRVTDLGEPDPNPITKQQIDDRYKVVTDARLASISVDDDGLGTIDVIE